MLIKFLLKKWRNRTNPVNISYKSCPKLYQSAFAPYPGLRGAATFICPIFLTKNKVGQHLDDFIIILHMFDI